MLTNYWGNKALDYLIYSRQTWCGLHMGEPGPTGEISTEVTGGSYERQRSHWNVAASRQIANYNVMTFENMPQTIVWYAGVWDAQHFGNMIAYGRFGINKHVGDGDLFIITAAQLVISL
jgi:hypothetical protein